MGSNCVKSSDKKYPPSLPKYSWDKRRDEVDVLSFIIEKVYDTEAGRAPGSIKGEQFIVRDCKNSSIFLFDHINTITVDECSDCRIFIGPTKGSIFIRDSKNCSVIASCGQFRTRDCINLNIFLCCPTQPIIEESANMRFGCFQYFYEGLREHFLAAGLSPYNNIWWKVHDFSFSSEETNWRLIGECLKIEDFIGQPSIDKLCNIGATSDPGKSFVPLTIGSRNRCYECHETSVVLLKQSTSDRDVQSMEIQNLLTEIKSSSPLIVLIQTRQLIATRNVMTYPSTFVLQGNIIALQFGGPDCVKSCQEAVGVIVSSYPELSSMIYASDSYQTAKKDIKRIIGMADIQLGI